MTKNRSPSVQREHFFVGALGKLPMKDRTLAFYVSIVLAAALILVGLCVAPNLMALGGSGITITRLWKALSGH